MDWFTTIINLNQNASYVLWFLFQISSLKSYFHSFINSIVLLIDFGQLRANLQIF